MHRQDIRNEIESIEPLDLLEVEHRADALAWVDSGVGLVRLTKPATPPKHLVSYFSVLDGESILLVNHTNAQLWLPTGGHVNIGEHPRETVSRELLEELGFLPSHEIGPPLMVSCTVTSGRTAGHTDVSLWYVVHAKQSQVLKFDDSEFASVRWFPFLELPLARSDPNLSRFVEKVRSRKTLK